jgi:hypothetical protein
MDEIRRIGIAEILNPTFGTTEQFLEVLKVQSVNSIPIISHIKIDSANSEAIVYFPVEGERFFIAIYLDTGEELKIRSVETEAGSSVYLSVGTSNSSDIELPITAEKVYDDFKIYGTDIDQPDSVEAKIEKLLDYLEPYEETIKKISEKNDVTINVAYFGYQDQMWGLHLDSPTMRRIANLNAELDFDIYAEGKALY